MSQQLDTQGEAHEALGTAVASYGQRVLSDPHTLGNHRRRPASRPAA